MDHELRDPRTTPLDATVEVDGVEYDLICAAGHRAQWASADDDARPLGYCPTCDRHFALEPRLPYE